MVVAAVEARLGCKSTQRETRAQRFLGIHDRNNGVLPVPLAYYSAHTGRYGGDEKINMQNLQRTDKKDKSKGLLRQSIKAPPGHALVVADLSQIEARLLVYQANQTDKVEAFAQKRDVYSEQASVIYGREVNRKKNPDDFEAGFVGKATILGCLSPHTRVLCDSGWKNLIDVTTEDELWDGVEWVKHSGVVEKGEKEVAPAHGLVATYDHLVLTKSGWRQWKDLVADESLFQSALSSASLPSSIGNAAPPSPGTRGGIRSFAARVAQKVRWIAKTSPKVQLLGVGIAEGKKRNALARSTGGTQISSRMTPTELAFSTASLRSSAFSAA